MDQRLEPTTALHPRSIALTNTPRHRRQPTRLRAKAHTGREAGACRETQSMAITSLTEDSNARSCPPEPRKGGIPFEWPVRQGTSRRRKSATDPR